MSVEVLGNSTENSKARDELRRRGLDSLTPFIKKWLHKTHILKGVEVGDRRKSWDVLRTLQFVEHHVAPSEPVLDLGAYSCEVLLGLQKLGFTDLTGIDLNPALPKMPFNGVIKYVTGDFTSTPFAAETFRAITAISVIEHGFSPEKIFREVSRLLKPGGFFLGSTDYWPEKIETNGLSAFGMEWKIFSEAELRKAIDEAGNYGLVPVGPLNLEASERTVSWLNRYYTFAWFALKKVDSDGR
jgi:SAM-dependent methyltransferase